MACAVVTRHDVGSFSNLPAHYLVDQELPAYRLYHLHTCRPSASSTSGSRVLLDDVLVVLAVDVRLPLVAAASSALPLALQLRLARLL